MLLTIEEIKQGLDEEFLELEPEITGYRLIESEMSNDLVQELNSIFSVKLPDEFRELILRYDFGDLSVGRVWFGNNDNYFKFLLDMNLESQEYPWWGTGDRPENLLFVGATDGYVILLDCDNGYIKAYLRAATWQDAEIISKNFNLFFRGTATAYLSKNKDEKTTKDIFKEVLSEETTFWSELIEGIA